MLTSNSRLPPRKVVLVPFLSLLMTMLLLSILTLAQRVSSTITVVRTGAHFPSRPDRVVGNHWMDGVEYMARMQLIESNLDLCPMHMPLGHNITITVPSDGLPVALLVKGDSCLDSTKLDVAFSNIVPKGNVKYLIIYSPESVTAPHHGRHLHDSASTFSLNGGQDITAQGRLLGHSSSFGSVDSLSHVPWVEDDFNRRIGILHITSKAGADLMSILKSQDQAMQASGGIRILLDGKSSPDHPFLRNLLFWIGLSLMMSGCVCSFCLSMCMQDTAAPPPPPPPDRRRLTQEQVESWLPEYQMSGKGDVGTDLHCECSICLDDLQHDDFVRRLPCNHEYHSDCIAKWLIERYSTCPLCKLDLLPEDDEDDDDDVSVIEDAIPNPPEGGLTSNWSSAVQLFTRSFPWRRSALQSIEIEQGDGIVDQTPLLQNESAEYNA